MSCCWKKSRDGSKELGEDLIYAIRNGDLLAKIQDLLRRGADVNAVDSNNSNETALIYASSKGRVDVVVDLLQHGANVNLADNHGYTALIRASMKGHLNVILELLKYKVNVNARTNQGNTALICA